MFATRQSVLHYLCIGPTRVSTCNENFLLLFIKSLQMSFSIQENSCQTKDLTLFSAAADDIWKHCDKGRNCSCRINFFLCHNVFKVFQLKICFSSFSRVNIQDFSKCRLQQDCCMGERADYIQIGSYIMGE